MDGLSASPSGKQVAKMAVFAVADGTIEADRVTAHRQHAASFIDRRFATASDFFETSVRDPVPAATVVKRFARETWFRPCEPESEWFGFDPRRPA